MRVPCRIINRSKVPLKFEWRSHGTEEDDLRSAAGPDAGGRDPEGHSSEGSMPASESDFSQNAGQSMLQYLGTGWPGHKHRSHAEISEPHAQLACLSICQ